MIKDLVVNLSAGTAPDVGGEYAISVADAFRAHVSGIAFAFEPILPPSVMGGLPPDLVEAQRAEGENAANLLASRFEESARRAGLSLESCHPHQPRRSRRSVRADRAPVRSFGGAPGGARFVGTPGAH